MNGFKVFSPDWTGWGFQYEVGQTYEETLDPDVCNRGFHFCKKAADCFNYYNFNPVHKVAEVIAHGVVAETGDKCATNKIEIVREIPWTELLELVNTGKADTGRCNSGDYNSGDYNSGHRNSGDCNSGDCNSGNCNSGDWNSGRYNSGDFNSGNYNSGNWNSGNWNSGRYNSGDWNKASLVAGCFNTEKHDLLFFDNPTKMTFEEWRRSDACRIMNRVDFHPVDWIWESDMTDEEKTAHPDYKTTGGYLKIRDNKDCFCEWWDKLTKKEKEIIKNIPNFDAEKFKLITGVEV